MTTAHRYRVLVVDDEDDVLVTTHQILSPHFDVTTCHSSQEALEIMGSGSYDVVCADLRMPGMDGLDLLLQVAGRPDCTSGLLLTGQIEALAQKPWSENCRVGLMLKPYDADRLISAVEHFARLAHLRRSVTELANEP
jgi:DNA-binding NtrC family response regulator